MLTCLHLSNFSTIIYLDLVPGISERFSASREPRFVINLPKRDTREGCSTSSKASKQAKSRKSVANDGEWLSSKSKPTKRKKTAKGKAPKKPRATKSKSSKAGAKKAAGKKPTQQADPIGVIELSSDDEDMNRKPSVEDIFLDSETDEEEWMG